MSTSLTAREALAGLLEATASPAGRNDLGRLAQMHTWCQVLTEQGLPTGCHSLGDVRHVAGTLAVLLERIILDEAADAEAGLALLPAAAQALSALVDGQPVSTGDLLAGMKAAIGSPGALSAATEPVAPEPRPGPPKPIPLSPSPAGAEEPKSYVSEPLLLDLSEAEHLHGFLQEAAEHMDVIEAGLLEVERNPADQGKLNELFRPFHTIKGISGFLNLRDINRLTHEIETILDLGRKGELIITAATVDLIFAAVDTLKAQLAAIREYLAAPTGGPCPQPEISAIMTRLQRAVAGELTDGGGLRPAGDGQDARAAPRPRLGEIMVEDGAVCTSDVQAALELQAVAPPPPRKLGEILVDAGVATESQVERALGKQSETGRGILDGSIRVDTAKLDALVDAVGELVIAQSMVGLSQTAREDDRLARNIAQVSKIVRDVQEIAMAMRMVPIGQTLQKMRRLVRDVARKAGKRVELEISGEETELDKNVIQQISDPLVHMVRNAVDHGIESPQERRAAGKPETGLIQLNAFHRGDSIVIEVRDDGRGLDREQLLAKGIERGLVSPDEHLTDQQVFGLIMHAGFSTAQQVTDISGRGVGMDVVKRNVEQLRGRIDIHSEKGRGSTFSIGLPLTLAIIDGMIVRVGRERVIIPTILIEQSMRPEPRQITSVQGRGQMLQVRGRLCPLIQLAPLFGYGPPASPHEKLVVIVQAEERQIALVVEELIGQQQVVIKGLGERFKKVRGVSGAAILGDGRVGLILEPSGVLAAYNDWIGSVAGFSPGGTTRGTSPARVLPASEAGSGGSEQSLEELTIASA